MLLLTVATASALSHPAFAAQEFDVTGKVAYTVGGFWKSWLGQKQLDGAKPTPLTARVARTEKRSDREPRWSPDGRRIAFVRRDGTKRSVIVASADGTGQLRVASGADDLFGVVWKATGVAWAPDSRSLAFDRPQRLCGQKREQGVGIYVVDTVNGVTRVVIRAPVRSGFRTGYDAESWSPDGTQLAAVETTIDCSRKSTRQTLFTVRRDGSARRNLVTIRARIDAIQQSFFGSASWSPDGRRIAYTSHCDDLPGGEITCSLRVINANGTRQMLLRQWIFGVDHSWASPESVLFAPGCCVRPNVVDDRLLAISVDDKTVKEVLRNVPFASSMSVVPGRDVVTLRTSNWNGQRCVSSSVVAQLSASKELTRTGFPCDADVSVVID